MSTSRLVFVDTETTGLDPNRHEIWETAWASEEGPVQSAFFTHKIGVIDPSAARVNKYFDRLHEFKSRDLTDAADLRLKQDLLGATIVGANPAFDTAMLYARWGIAPWHYRLIDIGAYAMPIMGYDRPPTLISLRNDLVDATSFQIPEPTHTATSDVTTLRICYKLLTAMSADLIDATHQPFTPTHLKTAIDAMPLDALGIPT